jgi:hypothetical protein
MNRDRRYEVFGRVSFPIRFKIGAASIDHAMNYASMVINSSDLAKAEVELLMKNGKEHLIICKDININWDEAKEE